MTHFIFHDSNFVPYFIHSYYPVVVSAWHVGGSGIVSSPGMSVGHGMRKDSGV